MNIARRKFIKAGAIAAIIGATMPVTKGAVASRKQSNAQPTPRTDIDLRAASENPPGLLAYYGKSAFNSYLNTSFQLSLGASVVGKMTLSQIIDMVPLARQKTAALEGKECFALRFRASRSASLQQETYIFKHDALGTLEMLLVPAGADRNGSYYEATINRLDS